MEIPVRWRLVFVVILQAGRSPALPRRLRPRPEPSNHPLNTATAVELLARARKPAPIVVKPGSRQLADGPTVTSAKQKFAIRMAVFGHPDKLAEPVSLGLACRAAGLQQRAARRLMQSAVFVAALAEAQADRAALEAAQRSVDAPPAPLAAIPAPEPADEGIIYVDRLPVTDERNGALVRVAAPAPVEPPPVDGKITRSGRTEFDLRKHRERFPFDEPSRGSTVVQPAPRRSLRRS